MKIENFGVEYLQVDARLTIVATIPRNQLAAVLARITSDQPVLELTAEPVPTLTPAAPSATVSTGAEASTRSRRSRASQSAPASSDPAPDAGDHQSAETSASAAQTQPASEEGAPRRRRPLAGSPAETAATFTPQTTDAQSAAPARLANGAPARTRTRPTSNGGGAETTSGGDGPIADAELGKAASDAAAKITAGPVKEILALFVGPNGKVNDIKAEDRRKFLDTLKQRVAEEAA